MNPGQLAVLVAAVFAVTVGAALTRRFTVEGRSMLPAFAPGDRVLVRRILRDRPRVGQAVVVRQPGGDYRLDLKRLSAAPGSEVWLQGRHAVLGPDEWFVTGDNAAESTDSRQLGPVRSRDIAGVVWLKY